MKYTSTLVFYLCSVAARRPPGYCCKWTKRYHDWPRSVWSNGWSNNTIWRILWSRQLHSVRQFTLYSSVSDLTSLRLLASKNSSILSGWKWSYRLTLVLSNLVSLFLTDKHLICHHIINELLVIDQQWGNKEKSDYANKDRRGVYSEPRSI